MCSNLSHRRRCHVARDSHSLCHAATRCCWVRLLEEILGHLHCHQYRHLPLSVQIVYIQYADVVKVGVFRPSKLVTDT